MAQAAAHDEQMENFVGTKIFMSGIKNRQLQGIDDAANGINNPAGQKPAKCLGRKGIYNLCKGKNTYPAHGNI